MLDSGVIAQTTDVNLVVMDVCALYPNIKIDLALTAVKEALHQASDYDVNEVEAIIDLLDYCLRHSVVHWNMVLVKRRSPYWEP